MKQDGGRKVVIIGDPAVGKTSIMSMYIYNRFDQNSMPTLGAGFKTKPVPYNTKDGREDFMKLIIWDTAGQEKFDALTKMYFNGAEAAFIVYDVTDEESFNQTAKWERDLAETDPLNKRLKYLVGNKVDLESQKNVNFEKGSEYAKQIGAHFFEVSAKDNIGLTDLFEDCA